MAKTRRIIRKVKTGPDSPFDEQMWPVNVALLVLGAYLVGIVLAIFPFDHPQPLLNAITWLSVIAVGVPLIMWGLWYVDNRTLRRSVQLAAVLSLIVNLSVMVFLAMFDLIPVPQIESPETKDPLAQRRDVVVPDYHPSHFETRERPKQDFERPVETKIPEPTEEEVPHQETSPKDPETRPEPTPVPEPENQVRPNPIKRAEMAESAPRRSEMESRLSRQLAQAQLRPATPAATEEVTTRAQRRPTPIEAQTTQVQRQATEMQVRQRTAEAEPTVERPNETLKLARRQAETAPTPESTSTPTLTRRVETPKVVPRTTAAAEQVSAAARRTSPDALRPNNTSAARQAPASVEMAEATAEPAPHTPTTISQQVVARQSQAQAAPSIAQMPTPVNTRRNLASVRPNISTSASAVAATRAPTESSQAQLRPTASSVARQASRVETTNPTAAAAEAPSSGTQIQVARASTRRADLSSVPTIDATAAPSSTPRRSTRPAAAAVSPSAVASAMAVTSESSTSAPTPAPAKTALSRAFVGVAGVGSSRNLDRGMPAEDKVAMVASGSAQRRRATQNNSGQPALNPMSVARISRSRSGADAPSATFRAQNVEMATAAGTQMPSEIQASASAAITEASSDAAEGLTSASRGAVEVDLGPTQVVSNDGSERNRASGGGQPDLNFQVHTTRITRRGVGSGPTVALAANAVAEQTAAPEGEGGGAPNVLEANTEATAATRTDTDGDLPTTGGESFAEDTGAPAVASTASLVGKAEIGRAEVVQAAPGMSAAGGGTGSPARAATGPAMPSSTAAEMMAMAGEPESSGIAAGAPLAAQGTQTARAAVGLLATASDDVFGAEAGAELVDAPSAVGPGRVTGVRRASPSRETGPAVADVAFAGGPLRRAPLTGLPVGATEAEQVPAGGVPSPEIAPDAMILAGGVDNIGVDRQAAGAIPVSVDAMDGPGGIGGELTPNAGVAMRRAQAESTEVHFRTARYIRKRSGGLPGLNVTAAIGADAFARRATRRGDETGGEPGRPSEKTEETIELGLHFLARHQMADGSWTLNNFGASQPQFEEEYVDERAALHSDIAATGMSLMAFFGAGYHHKDDKYAETVQNGLDFLLKHQKENGDLYVPLHEESDRSVWFYSHGIATIALCEAYGMTQDPDLREPAQKAIQFVLDSQHPVRGGWRYSPQYGSDTSVTGWLMMALMSARLANLEVPDEVFEKIEGWLDKSQVSGTDRHLYRYNPFAPDTEAQKHGRKANETMTAVGLLMRLYVGWRRDNQHMIRGADYLMENLPAIGTRRNPQRDTYYWYYATQVMFHMKGKYWEAWNEKLHPMLVTSQIKEGTFAGSWDPRRPVADRWAPHAGRMYVTTMNLLSLEVYYRHMPIYEDTLE
jgi:hypothetical protein